MAEGLYAATAPDFSLARERPGDVDCGAHHSGHRSSQFCNRPRGSRHDPGILNANLGAFVLTILTSLLRQLVF
jgi:hypothetical protein